MTQDEHIYYLKLVHTNNRTAFDDFRVDMKEAKELSWLTNQSKTAEIYFLKMFQFSFYGHNVEKIYVTTEGFISVASRYTNILYNLFKRNT